MTVKSYNLQLEEVWYQISKWYKTLANLAAFSPTALFGYKKGLVSGQEQTMVPTLMKKDTTCTSLSNQSP